MTKTGLPPVPDCPTCGKILPDDALVCPYCQSILPQKRGRPKAPPWVIALLIVIIIALFIYAVTLARQVFSMSFD